MIKKCEYPNCHRKTAQYYQGWSVNGHGEWGVVCATHDRELGYENLLAAGFDKEEAYTLNLAIIKESKS